MKHLIIRRKNIIKLLAAMSLVLCLTMLPAFADEAPADADIIAAPQTEQTQDTATESDLKIAKAYSAAFVLGIPAAVGVIAMAWAVTKATDGIARQPEADGKIRGGMMLGLVFIETLIIYALIVAILIVFVL